MTATLQRQVLVLNKSWVPVNITSARRAIVLIYTDLARAVCHKTYQTFIFDDWIGQAAEEYVSTVSLDIPVPEVIVLDTYNKVRSEAKLPFSRVGLLRRDKNVCQYCSNQYRSYDLTVDHVLPKSRGGKTVWTNCVIACKPCNAKKDDKTPEEAKMKLLKQPVIPTWSFRLTDEITIKNSWKNFIKQ